MWKVTPILRSIHKSALNWVVSLTVLDSGGIVAIVSNDGLEWRKCIEGRTIETVTTSDETTDECGSDDSVAVVVVVVTCVVDETMCRIH